MIKGLVGALAMQGHICIYTNDLKWGFIILIMTTGSQKEEEIQGTSLFDKNSCYQIC